MHSGVRDVFREDICFGGWGEREIIIGVYTG